MWPFKKKTTTPPSSEALAFLLNHSFQISNDKILCPASFHGHPFGPIVWSRPKDSPNSLLDRILRSRQILHAQRFLLDYGP